MSNIIISYSDRCSCSVRKTYRQYSYRDPKNLTQQIIIKIIVIKLLNPYSELIIKLCSRDKYHNVSTLIITMPLMKSSKYWFCVVAPSKDKMFANTTRIIPIVNNFLFLIKFLIL